LTLYSEIDPFACAWLRELCGAGHIAGSVIEGDIRAIKAERVRGQRFHAFAGIGAWEYALQLAGVPADVPIWTGSCPCQPFSAAGKRAGTADERHLWPDWFRLIEQCRPPVIFGEQVASNDGLVWLDAVSTDLERAGYAFGAADLCAASVGAPHIRQRLYFVAHAHESGRGELQRIVPEDRDAQPWLNVDGRREASRPWAAADWLPCRDGASRPVEPGTFPLVDGTSNRVGRLRGYGNAIVPQVAATFIRAALASLRGASPLHVPRDTLEQGADFR